MKPASEPTFADPSSLSNLMKMAQGLPATAEDFFRAMCDALPTAVYATDAEGRIRYFNEAAAELWGARPEIGKSEWCGSLKLYRADGTPLPHDQCPMAIAIRERRAVRGVETIAERPDGSRVAFVPYPTPLHDRDGEFVGAVNMLVDVTNQRRSDEAAQRLAMIVEFSEDAILSKDLDGRITSWNGGATRLFGWSAEEAVGRSIFLLIPPDRHDEEREILRRLKLGERIEHYETVRQRKDGGLVDISLTVSPLKNASGEIIGASKIARDVTERKRIDQLQNLLLRETKHRVKNTLATVQAIATQTLHSAREEREVFVGRLQALANAHDLLHLENWNRTRLRDVISSALKPFLDAYPGRITLVGVDEAGLNPDRSLILTMALHELATNSVKYGALSQDRGKVEILCAEANNGVERIRLTWRESGGPAVHPPTRNGFGSRLISRSLRGELGDAQFDFRPEGLVCTLEISPGQGV